MSECGEGRGRRLAEGVFSLELLYVARGLDARGRVVDFASDDGALPLEWGVEVLLPARLVNKLSAYLSVCGRVSNAGSRVARRAVTGCCGRSVRRSLRFLKWRVGNVWLGVRGAEG